MLAGTGHGTGKVVILRRFLYFFVLQVHFFSGWRSRFREGVAFIQYSVDGY
jgi:hypothetical protein